MSGEVPSPFVYWAQDASNIFLKVDLKDIKDQNVKLDKKCLELSAVGVGARGTSPYSFSLNFFDDIDSEDEVHTIKSTDRVVEITLKKKQTCWWPRLIKHQQKPAWLKVDFDRWRTEEDELSETESKGHKDIMGDYADLYKDLSKQEFGYFREDFKKVYLIIYNLMQFVLFSYILIVMGIRYYRYGEASMPGTYEAVGPALKFVTLLQYLEVMHPMFGYTKGSMTLPFIQTTGRTLILLAMVEAEPRMQTKAVVFYLICCWSLIEVFRYPYYITALYKRDIGLLTWLRYTLWIPLYPLGILCEGIIILRNIPYFEETQRFVVSMPNAWNFTFYTPAVMKVYLLFLFFPGSYTVMMHMYRARTKKLGRRKLKIR